jgi:uncharacterized protein with NRDE domain
MCTLAIYFRMSDEYPVIIAANRDEFLDRPAASPTTLSEKPRVVGGRDLRAGGTWLGINEHGLVAGLLNRRSEQNDPNRRSRGLLCLDALGFARADEAARFVGTQRSSDYNPFNLLIASREETYVAYNRAERIEIVPLSPGLHLLTNLNVDDFECPRISASYAKFAELGSDPEFLRDPVGRRGDLRRLLSDHRIQLDPRNGRPNALCLHLDSYGTRSSSLILLGRKAGREEHFFAPGPPCASDYERAPTPMR